MTISKTLTHVTGMRGRNSWFLGALVTLFLTGTPAGATMVNFTCVPGSIVECVGVAAQLVVEVKAPALDQIRIVIGNPGPLASNISEVYFDFEDSLFSGFASSAGGAVVDFPIGGTVTPPDLPGGNPIGFSSNLAIAAASPSPTNGIGVGESLTLVLDIGDPNTLANVVAQFISGDLQIGFHIQGIGLGGGSASVVSSPLPTTTTTSFGDDEVPPGVPEPSTWLLMSAGVVGLIARRSFIR
jgi:hypothetical protein